MTKATSNLEDAAEKHRAKLTLETIDKRVATRLSIVSKVNFARCFSAASSKLLVAFVTNFA